MKVAITADLHLTDESGHPARFKTLRRLLKQCANLDVDTLIIAGDLFDRRMQDFADFESVYQEARPPELEVLALPGNHDLDLAPGALAVPGLRVIEEVELFQLGDAFNLLLVPYKPETTMGERLSEYQGQLAPGSWGLVSHADWVGGHRKPEADEPGVYMPLTRADLIRFQPAYCVLGHLHVPISQPPIYTPGSPCPLDITETGFRRMLILNSEDRSVKSATVDSARICFDERIVVLPMENSIDRFTLQLEEMIKGWELPPDCEGRIQLRLKVAGYVKDRAGLLEAAQERLAKYELYPGSPDLSDLHLAGDVDRAEIAQRVEEVIHNLGFERSPFDPSDQEILEEALTLIYAE